MKVTLPLFLPTLALLVAFFGHEFATGVVLPYHDPTPAQAAHERFHHPISKPSSSAWARHSSLAWHPPWSQPAFGS
jgi:hypothetical protein